jgi:putative transposase
MIQRKTYKFRIYPTKAQETSICKTLNICKSVYNRTLAIRKETYEKEKRSVSYIDTIKLLTQWKKEDTSLKEVYSQVLQDVQKRVDNAFMGFFRRVKRGETPGYPRFKSWKRYDSFTYPQNGFKIVDNKLKLSKIGNIKVVQNRYTKGKIKTLTIRKSSTNKWFACIQCEIETEPKQVNPSNAVGIDLGLINLATLTDGAIISNPKFYKQEEKGLSKAQRNKKTRKVINRIYERIYNKRHNYLHHVSKQIVKNYDIICLEKLNIKNMLKSKGLNKSLYDTALHQLTQMIVYKAEEAGKTVILVDPRNTSKRCSQCETLVEKDLSERTHSCSFCGLVIDRDLNAARNILALGLQSLPKKAKSSSSNVGE